MTNIEETLPCAPIIIPTLNRHKHLRKCIESLKKCELAANTELFISVDYPPSEKYVSGYNKVLDYLSEEITGFKKVHIIKHNHNIGPGKHSIYLQNLIFEHFDRYIFTEDDNEFEPSFLRFINENLEKYKDDETVTSICGYCHPINWSDDHNCVIRNNLFFSGWGYAVTKTHYNIRKQYTWKTVFDYLHSFKNAISLYKANKYVFHNAVYIASRKHYLAFFENYQLRYMDSTMGVIQAISNSVQIVPSVSKLHNIGYDGSGVNCESAVNSTYSPTTLDSRATYDISLQKELCLDENHRKQLNELFKVKPLSIIKTWIIWFLLIKLK